MIEAIVRKARESAALKQRFVEENAPALEACVRALAERFAGGGRLFVMGNGGSACDAQHVAVEFVHPVVEKRRPLPAIALTTDTALLTAVGNDGDFSHVFAAAARAARPPGRRGAGDLDSPARPPTSTGRCGARASAAC